MTKKILIVLIIILISSAGFITADGGWYVGDRVLADWSGDDYWYPGTIIDIDKGYYYILYDDGDEEWLSGDYLMYEDLGVGDYIEANWKFGGWYYPGVIAERYGDEIYIEYDDGDVEWTTIAAVRVLFYY